MADDNTDREALAKELHQADRNWSRQHNKRYLAEFDFDWDGLNDKGREYWRAQVDALSSLGWVKAEPDPWCHEERCRYRHWVNEGYPSHKRDAHCLVPDTTKEPTP